MFIYMFIYIYIYIYIYISNEAKGKLTISDLAHFRKALIPSYMLRCL